MDFDLNVQLVLCWGGGILKWITGK